MAEINEILSQEVPCPDPECNGIAEPDQDGEHLFYECQVCGYSFGYEKAPTPTAMDSDGGTCAVGIPEELRRAASQGMERAMSQPPSVPVTIGRKRG